MLVDTNAAALAALPTETVGSTLTAAEWNALCDSLQEANAATRTANTVYGGPASGAAAAGAFRALVEADLPAHGHEAADVTDFASAVAALIASSALATDAELAAAIAALSAVYVPLGVAWTDLTDAGDSAAHFHAADRARANHTGSQLAATISDFAAAVNALLTAAALATDAEVAAAVATLEAADDVLTSAIAAKPSVGYVDAGDAALDTRLDAAEGTLAGLGDLATLDTVADAQVAANAAVALSKLAVVTASRALVSDAGGLITAHGTVSATELGYLNDVTSAIQTQLDARQPLAANLTQIGALADPNADRLLFWDDSAGAYVLLTLGTNLTITGTTIDAAGGGGAGTKTLARWSALANEPPASAFATFDLRNSHPVLDFDDTAQEAAIFPGVMPEGYAGENLVVSIYCLATSAVTGTIGWDVTFERIDAAVLDIDADGWATAQTVTAVTVPGTSGVILKMSVTVTAGATGTDSIAAGDMFRLRVRRDVANDSAVSDAELVYVTLERV